MIFTSIRIHLYGVIPGKYFDLQMRLPEEFNLVDIESKVVRLYRRYISKQYITPDELLNHECIVAVDSKGRHLSATESLKGLKEIWFIIPIAGG